MTRAESELDRLAEQWVDTLVELEPELSIHLGRPGHESDYADLSPDGHAALADAERSMLARVRAATPGDDVDRVTQLELIRVLELGLDAHESQEWRRDLNVIASAPQSIRDVFDLMPTDSTEDWAAIARRLANVPAAVDGYLTTLRSGVGRGLTPAVRQVTEVAAQVGRQAAFFTELAGRPQDVPAGLAQDLERGGRAAAEAYVRLGHVLADEIAPHARIEDAVGREAYALASRGFIGAEVDLDETYAWGVEELARMVAEQEAVAREIVPGGTVADAVAHLDADPDRQLDGTDALRAWMQETSDRAVEELGRTHFDIPEQMRHLECMIAPTNEGGIYYTPPADDFSRPGRMWWSVPDGVTRFGTWRELTTVYHEGVPGHHLQCGYAVWNAAELNTWRRAVNWNSGHGEGWALYAERLMADLGYLDDPADRLGMLDGQRMRAARVVLDIGVHLGKPMPDGSGPWTGQKAFDFLAEHVNMDAAFVRFEVNRYLGWPGQAPSYKVGQRLWEQIRDRAAAQPGFDPRDFHRRALAVGSVGLDTLATVLV